MDIFRSYSQHLLATLWRRRSGILFLLVAFTVFVAVIHYQSVLRDNRRDLYLQPAKHSAQRSLHTVPAKVNFSDRGDGVDLSVKDVNQFPRQEEDKPPVPKSSGLSKPFSYWRSDVNLMLNKPSYERRSSNLATPPAEATLSVPILKISSDDRETLINAQASVSSPQLRPGNFGKQGQQVEGYHAIKISNDAVGNGLQLGVPGLVTSTVTKEPYIPKRRIVHLDLKGAPPRVDYLRKLLPMLKGFGATGLLLEYEDMFPFSGELRVIAAKNHYSKQDVQTILNLAEELHFEVIPLVQTFGHVEFVLKQEHYSSLREVPNMPQALCPLHNDTMPLVRALIDQVMALHQGRIRWLHIGCDEVFQLGMCPKCMAQSMSTGRDDLFMAHVAQVAQYVRDKYKVKPIIWDDMLHHMSTESLKRFRLGSLVEVMVWTYVQDIYRFVAPEVWAMYGEVFPYMWGASAYKGAFGETLAVPPVKTHLFNNLAWLDVLARESVRFTEVRGLVLTGWQRYDHFATLCELLPAAVPSLAINLLTVTHGYFNESWMQQLYEGLQCMKVAQYTSFVNLENDPYLWDKMAWCFFPGVTFFKITERLDSLRKTVTQFLQDATVSKAWMTEYNVRHNFTSIARVDNSMSMFGFHYPDVETLIRQARDALREVFDEYTVAEWIEQNVYPYLRKLELFRQTADALKKAVVWPVRPLEPLAELSKYGIGIATD